MQKTLNWIIVILVVVLLSFLGYYFYQNRSSHIETEKKFEKDEKESSFPKLNTEFNFKTLKNLNFKIKTSKKKIEIDELKNKLVFLKIFGWDCDFCKKEIPELIRLKRDLGDTFDVIAIEAQQHSKEESEKYIKEYGVNYHIVDGTEQTRFYDYLKIHYGWSGVIPLTIILGKGGNILAYEVGAKSYTLAELMKASILRDK